MKEAFDLIRKRMREELTLYEKAINIVSEVEEEYNNGWIPVEERLPEEPGLYLLSYENPNCIPTTQVFDGTLFRDRSGSRETHAVAWMPLPEPYKPIG